MRFRLRLRFLYFLLSVYGLALFSLVWRGSDIFMNQKWTTVVSKNREERANPMPTSDVIKTKIPLANGTKCNGLFAPIVTGDKQTWMKLADVDGYIFSAYYDDITRPIVRIIGLIAHNIQEKTMICQLWFSAEEVTSGLEVVNAELDFIPESHGKRYRATYFLCKIPVEAKPYAVSLVAGKCNYTASVIPVLYNNEDMRNFTVCVTPFNYRYAKAYQLIEFIEMNRILGADKIIFYNYSTNYNIDHILKWYSEKNLVHVVSWHLPMNVDRWPKTKDIVEVHYFGQLASLNDCLYRNLHVSKFLVYEDLDEFIVPKTYDNWTSLLNTVDRLSSGRDIGTYIFRNTFFRGEWADTDIEYSGKSFAKKYKSVVLLKLEREKKILPARQRSKYIIQPTKVETVGIHATWRHRSGYNSYTVPFNVALLHHYRNWERPDDPTPRASDDTMLRFKDKLISQIIYMWSLFEELPMDIPIN
ncbi:hypothetical protein ScPMuIL_002021 [Solemya velum]